MTADISLPKLVDLAIGTPDCGSVDFGTLHTLLHIIVRKLGSHKSHVELSPDHRKQLDPLISSLPQDPEIRVSIGQRDGHELFKVCEFREESFLEQDAPDDEQEEETPSPASKRDTTPSSIRLSTDGIQDITYKLEELEERTASILPTSEDFQRYLASRETLKPDEPVDFISLAARVDTIEMSLGKLMSTIDGIMFEFTRLEQLVLPYLDSGDITALKTQVHNISHLLAENFPGFRSRQPSERMSAIRRLTIERLPTDFYKRGVPSIEAITESDFRHSRRMSPRYRRSLRTSQDSELEREIEGIKSVLNGLIGMLPLSPSGSELVATRSDLYCEESSEKLPQANFHQKAADAIINLRTVQKEIDELFLEKEERLVYLERIQKESMDLQSKLKDTLDELQRQFVEVREGFELFGMDSEKKFNDFKDELDAQMRLVKKDVDYLKNDAVQRIMQLEFDVGDRVDFELFKTRVPMHLFEVTIAEISDSLESCKKSLKKYSASVTDQQSELIRSLQTKVDQKEFSSFQRSLTKRMGLLQLRLNKLLKIQETIDAAGTKFKSSGPLKCISCDHEATMTALEDIIPKNRLPQKSYPFVVDGGFEYQKTRCSGGLHTLVKKRAFFPKSCEGRRLVGHIKKQALEFKLTAVPPEDPAYKIHM